MTRPDDSWMADGECVQTGDLHHPEDGQSYASVARVARPICRRCEVEFRCLDWIMTLETAGTRAGIWGGTTPEERDALAKTGRMRPVKAPQGHAGRPDVAADPRTAQEAAS